MHIIFYISSRVLIIRIRIDMSKIEARNARIRIREAKHIKPTDYWKVVKRGL